MKKSVLGIVGVAVIAAVVVVVLVVGGGKDTTDKTTTKSSDKATTSKTVATITPVGACSLLTKTIGTKIVGSGATSTPVEDTKTASANTSNCSYFGGNGMVALTVYTPLNQDGIDANAALFKTLPDGAEKVSGYGDSAYWTAKFGQLSVLKDKKVYLLASGSVDPTSRTLKQTEQFADMIKNQF